MDGPVFGTSKGGGGDIANEAMWGGKDVINLLKLRWEVYMYGIKLY